LVFDVGLNRCGQLADVSMFFPRAPHVKAFEVLVYRPARQRLKPTG
jgi:hypothetical protein